MSYWAQIDQNNQVLQVTVGQDDLEDAYQWLCENHGGRWIETTIENYAGIGWTYVEDVGFYPPTPYSSWILNGLIWEAPEPKPEGDYEWDESQLKWVACEQLS